MSLTEILGWMATFLFTVCFIPQIVKTIKTKTVKGLSFLLLLLSFFANIIALAYATRIQQPPLQIKYALALVLLFICIILYIRIIKSEHAKKNRHGLVVWLTGLSGSGKTTLAHAVKNCLEADGKRVIVLDGDAVRETVHRKLGFSREDIRENNLGIARLAKEKKEEVEIVLVPVISPYREDREAVKHIIGSDFAEVYVRCPLEKCMERDTKGLYAKAVAGEIDSMIGYSPTNPYEPPTSPDLLIDTAVQNQNDAVTSLYVFIKSHL
ncbi:MAG: Adenylyl-sulfate kinase [Parcubacteria group bacterium GW2011_GWC2_45_7]|nr:MAG: Adenylyl-sulfate kinase [Parcubacteria group bacterium GW2011_GWC2_45_7]KKU74147.1 MAG: Adenylyl-sulfate kinase [Parcubacteria group bacterium GW2011_GWA2_47_26]